MSSLLVPKHVHARRHSILAEHLAVKASPRMIEDEIAAPLPKGLPRALFWRLHIIPIGIRTETRGGVLLSEQHTVDQAHLHGLGKIVSMGPDAYKADAFKACDASSLPRVGDVILFNPKAAVRFMRNGVLWFLINDDHVQAVVDPKEAGGYVFLDGVVI